MRRVARSQLRFELHRFPGASREDSIQDEGRQAGTGAYAEWIGARAAAHHDRRARKLSERRWQRDDSGSRTTLYGGNGSDTQNLNVIPDWVSRFVDLVTLHLMLREF